MDLFKKLDSIRRSILFLLLCSLLLLILGFALLAGLESGTLRTVFVTACFVLLLLTLLTISLLVSSYKQLFGQNMMKSIMEDLFEDVTYEPERALPASLIENTDMILMGNRYESGEYRTGVYRGIRFTMADVVLKNVIRSGKRTASVTYFSGSWMIFDFPHPFSKHLQVKEKSFLNAQKPKGQNPDMNRVTVGGENFARFFKVYAESESDAACFLTEALEKAIMTLNYELRGDLMFYFCEGRLHIALHGKRAQYEPPMLGKLYRDEVEKALLADCRAVSAFLDRLLEIDTLFLKNDNHKVG